MLKSLRNTLGTAKDKAVEASAKAFINRKIENFGTVSQLQLDSKQKTAALEVILKGEASPILVKIASYELIERGSEVFIRIHRIEASREWMMAAANQYLVGREFKVPDKVKFAL
ncbi:MAG TPA: hypothetical protein VEC99_13280 [Clostridia bacterium]|nr:hypothetical protein [Clostridia bacterium]